MSVFTVRKTGLTDRLNFSPTDRQRRLLARYLQSAQLNAIYDEPPGDLSKGEWKKVLDLLERLERACLAELPPE
jgi:predicted ABC-type transport system involved in lysophospholipase L1 biosynthesis ATPase subunit